MLRRSLFLLLFFFILVIHPLNLRAGGDVVFPLPDTDAINDVTTRTAAIFYVFDLRDRETYIQFTFPDVSANGIAHIQIFDVSNNCNENDFFDNYTPNDTHTYNMRDILTNDGNPSGVALPDGSYGIVAISSAAVTAQGSVNAEPGFGNLRILDSNGYEYRTNAVQYANTLGSEGIGPSEIRSSYFNFNNQGGVTFSDVIGVTVLQIFVDGGPLNFEWQALPVQEIFFPFDIDIYDLNEVPFSCRDVVFACVDEDNPLLPEILENSGISVASSEYGINNAVTHSKGGELLCPGNIVPEGTVVLTPEGIEDIDFSIPESFFTAFIGLNNGNGRGSMDSLWSFNWVVEGLEIIPED